jgi:hypothetical protein
MGTHSRLGAGAGAGRGDQGHLCVPVHKDAGRAGGEGGGELWMEDGRVGGRRGSADGGGETRGGGVREVFWGRVFIRIQ